MTGDQAAGQEHQHEHQHDHYGMLPDDGVVDLTDKLTGYMTEIELGGLSDIMGQVLDDFLDQSGGMPEDLKDPGAFDQISRNQLAVTLAYQLGRLEGRSPQVVDALVEQAIEKFGFLPVDESPEITDEDLETPKLQVYPRIRRVRFQAPQVLQVQRRDDIPDDNPSE
jgi:hypothetical protein